MFATFKITSTFVGSFYVLTIMICSMTEVASLNHRVIVVIVTNLNRS